jgi:putative transposase
MLDTIFAAADMQIIKTPVRAPRANAIAERRVGRARREFLDRVLITGERHLRLARGECADHYKSHRPHRSLQQEPPAGHAHPPVEVTDMRVLRRDRILVVNSGSCGGAEFEACQVAGSLPVERGAGPVGL